jgi:DNA-directed RNA polymerase subunit F
MSKENVGEKNLTLPQVKKLLESIGEDNLDQLQRRTFDYVSKFSKVDAEAVAELVERLQKEFGLEEEESVQIVNCLPKTVDELRVFLGGGRRIIDASTLKTVSNILGEHQKVKQT